MVKAPHAETAGNVDPNVVERVMHATDELVEALADVPKEARSDVVPQVAEKLEVQGATVVDIDTEHTHAIVLSLESRGGEKGVRTGRTRAQVLAGLRTFASLATTTPRDSDSRARARMQVRLRRHRSSRPRKRSWL